METGEQLNRRYWELQGYEEIEKIGGHWMFLNKSLALTASGRWHSRLPRLDLDTNLAIAEADLVFERWSHYRYVSSLVQVYTWLKTPTVIGKHDFYAEASGPHAFCEAILKALIAKGQK